VFGLGLKLYDDIVYENRQAKHTDRLIKIEQMRIDTYESLENALGQDVGAIQEQFDTGRLRLKPDTHGDIAEWKDRDTFSVYILYFADTGEMDAIRFLPQAMPGPHLPPLEDFFDRIRALARWMCPTIGGLFTPVVYVVWVPLLIIYFARSRSRGWLSFALASWAVLCPLVWLMASFTLLELNGVMSYDPNFWGLVMFTVTAIALASGGVHDRITDPAACKSCGYNLKGNQSGKCPECGGAVGRKQAEVLG